ncbi:60S ribosomal protein L12 [Fusarium oxysporum f. sp. albedinis]|nr:60S ribosomal protein L12 [Fusarium oxysporum f. sp. albedinis]
MRPSGKANHDAEFYEHTLISIDSRQQQPMDLRLVGSRSCQLLIPILLDIHASIWLVAGLMRSKAITCKSTTKLVQRHPMS